MTSSKDVDQLIDRAVAAGWENLGHGRRKPHIKMRWNQTGQVICLPRVPGDWRSIRNAEADMARISGPLATGRHRRRSS